MQPRIPFAGAVRLLPWVVALAEGFSTLAVEVIAIRLATPVVGSSVTLTGVMLAVVLLALSAGYWRGGALSARRGRDAARSVLVRNLLLAALLYGAVAFPLESWLLEELLEAGLPLAVAIGLAGSLLFVLPVYLASQTVPMLAELTDDEGRAGKASGRVLFFSTVGSVAGGVATPVWLFPSIGVARTTWVVCGLLAFAAATMAIGQLPAWKAAGAATAVVALVVSPSLFARADENEGLRFDSAYQTIRIVEDEDSDPPERVMMVGGGRASGIDLENGETSFAYARLAADLVARTRAERLLVVGAAGFTLPRDASALETVKQVDAIDVDPAVKGIAETYFLRRPLPAKVRFLPLSARYAVRRLRADGAHYGLAFLDAFFGQGIPEELATAEFLSDVRRLSDRTAANVILDPALRSAFARNLLATYREAFGEVWVCWVKDKTARLTNVVLTSWPAPGASLWNGGGRAYHDDRNPSDREHVDLVWGNR